MTLTINKTAMSIELEEKLFNVYQSKLSVAASYGNLESASFNVHASIESGMDGVRRTHKIQN